MKITLKDKQEKRLIENIRVAIKTFECCKHQLYLFISVPNNMKYVESVKDNFSALLVQNCTIKIIPPEDNSWCSLITIGIFKSYMPHFNKDLDEFNYYINSGKYKHICLDMNTVYIDTLFIDIPVDINSNDIDEIRDYIRIAYNKGEVQTLTLIDKKINKTYKSYFMGMYLDDIINNRFYITIEFEKYLMIYKEFDISIKLVKENNKFKFEGTIQEINL